MKTDQKRSVSVAVEIEYSSIACDRCGAEWHPPQPDGFASEHEYLSWKRLRDEQFSGRDPAGWHVLFGPVGARGGEAKTLHLCPDCVKALLPEAA